MQRTIAALSLAAAMAVSAAAIAHPGDDPRTVLVVVAHPDDELFMAPAIAGEARSGSRVIIVYATSGDAGPGVSGMEPGEALAQLRRKEAACAADALGAVPVFYDLGDGALGQYPRRAGSAAARLRDRLREDILGRRPEVIMTWGPDGGYGHADHRMVSAVTSEIVQALGSDVRPSLLYAAFAEGRLPESTPLGRWAGTDPELLTVGYSYSDADLASAAAAAQCHETQFDAPSRAGLMPFLAGTVWQGEVRFREAFPVSTR